jgi:5-methylcytosine-specific restriction protein A
VIVFHLVPEDRDGAVAPAEAGSVGDPEASLEELRRRALEAARPPEELAPRQSLRSYYERSAAVRSYILARAAGVCEACRRPAPFRRADGTPYLEPHHVRRRADGGLDHPRWVGAVCPNCHREAHHGEDGAGLNRRLQEHLHSIEPGEGIDTGHPGG